MMKRKKKTASQVGLRELLFEAQAVDILHHNWRDWDESSRMRTQTVLYVSDQLSLKA